MTGDAFGPHRLPRGRHGLSRDEVEGSQRERVCRGVMEVVAEVGYAQTTVARIVSAAAVSRETFYSLFSSKEEAYWAAYEAFAATVLETATARLRSREEPALEQLRIALDAYLSALAEDPDLARCFLLERPGRIGELDERDRRLRRAGRNTLQALFPEASTFICDSYSAVVSHHVAAYVVDNRASQLPELAPHIIRIAESLFGSNSLRPT